MLDIPVEDILINKWTKGLQAHAGHRWAYTTYREMANYCSSKSMLEIIFDLSLKTLFPHWSIPGRINKEEKEGKRERERKERKGKRKEKKEKERESVKEQEINSPVANVRSTDRKSLGRQVGPGCGVQKRTRNHSSLCNMEPTETNSGVQMVFLWSF